MTQTQNFSQTAAFLWSVADLLRGDFKQSQYGRIILPFTLLRRLECVLADSKAAVVAKAQSLADEGLPDTALEMMLLRETNGLKFCNASPMDLSKLGQRDIKDNLSSYVQSFSTDAREIFEHFKFDEFVGQLNDANLLFKVVKKFATTDLSPQTISNHDMGLVFEELIRRFAESSNETAGEHFTPRDIVRLTTSMVFIDDDEALSKGGFIRTIYDPTAGTGGFLSSGMEFVHELNPATTMKAFGQELNPESYAICKADMMIKGQEVDRIKLGNTLSNDQLPTDRFDYMLSNPPFGVDWKKIESEIKDEHLLKGETGRFAPGLPRVSDGSLLFLLHLISKMRDIKSVNGVLKDGARIGIILNGSPLFTGSAGSGESEIRRYILEKDLLEAIVALPNDMFYNTGIATYIWILSNKKAPQRKQQVQLIDASKLCGKMRKSLGSKRNVMSDDDIRAVIRCFGDFEAVDTRNSEDDAQHQKPLASKIFGNHEFGYRRITVERPLLLSAQITDEKIASLRFAPKPFNNAMQALYAIYQDNWSADNYGELTPYEQEVRKLIKQDFPELKEKQIKDLLSVKIWRFQQQLMAKAETLQTQMGSEQSNDFNQFDKDLKTACKTEKIPLDAKEKKQLLDAITWRNPDAEPVIKKVNKAQANPLYGEFEYQAPQGKKQVVNFQPDSELRDFENIPLNPALTTPQLIEAYFNKEVAPHVPDAWINPDKRDEQDDEIGVVGYEIPFNRHFYVYQPPRPLAEIDADLDKVSAEIMQLLQEVHS